MRAGLWLPLAAFALSASAALAQAPADPFVGRWSMNTSESRYPPQELPRSMLITMQAVPGGVHYRSLTERRDGRQATAEYTAGYDGTPALVEGDSGLLVPVELKRVDENTVEASYKRGLQQVAWSRRVVSGDGRRMIVTTRSMNAAGQPIESIGVYERVDVAVGD